MDWNKENTDTLMEMWQEGFTARQIANKLGQGVTRNAVIGKAHRLGLSHRPVSIVKHNRSFPTLGKRHKTCRWIYGDRRDKTARFCDKPVGVGKSYCEEHALIVYRQPHSEEKRADQENATLVQQAIEDKVKAGDGS